MTAVLTDSDIGHAIAAAAQRYRDRGYRIVLSPSLIDLPDFLAGTQPDALAEGANETVAIVAIDAQRPDADRRAATTLAEVLHERPGWRLDAVVVGRDISVSSSDVSYAPQKIAYAIESAVRFFGAGEQAAGVLLLASAMEACAGLALRRHEISPKRPLFGQALFELLVHEGLIGQDDYAIAREFWALRSRIAHGGLEVSVPRDLFEKTVRLARSILIIDPQRGE